MKALLAVFIAVFLLTFLARPTMGAGWSWDAGNAIGFAAFAGILYLTLTSSRRLDVRAHRVFGYAVLSVAVAHAFWFLLSDAAVVEFVKPGAPDYMWHGIVSLLLLAVLMMVAMVPERMRLHRDYASFRYWHRVLAVATIATASYHIVVSNFYLGTWHQALLFTGLAAAIAFGHRWWARLGQLQIAGPFGFIVMTMVATVLFAAVRNFPP